MPEDLTDVSWEGVPPEARRRIEKAWESRVTELNLSHLGLTALPEAIGRLQGLQKLDISGNRLTALPEVIGDLKRLQYLDLSRNRLTVLPEEIGRLQGLQRLDLSSNQLTALPEAIGRLQVLRTLDIPGNQLTALPEAIGRLGFLRTLSVAANRLERLPESVGRLSRLKILLAGGNPLQRLPELWGGLTALEVLDLSNSAETLIWLLDDVILPTFQKASRSEPSLPALPEGLRHLPSLKVLLLHGQEALGLPPEVLGPTWKQAEGDLSRLAKPADILDYYFRTRGGKRPLNEAKLILVGFGNVGKTSLVKRLVHNRFSRQEAKTEGIQITQWPVHLNRRERATLHVWDFGGQEIMHATHQFFLTQRSLYLLVLNGRQGHEDEDAEYWLRLIGTFGEDCPVIVVLNKIREHPFTLDRLGLQRKFPNIREVIETDCGDRTGIEALRDALHRETDRLEHLRAAFPSAWFAIKDRLAGMSENFISFDRYREICAEHAESDASAQEALASFLHSLGIALNYRDDPRLRDTHVLNPRWVTSGIYTILNAPLLAERAGVIAVADLAKMLDRKDYPSERHGFLLELMRKFELCFRFPEDDRDERYLIPELLPKDQPDEAADFRPEDCLNFRYLYPVLPEGLVPRFIVRTHVLSEGLPRWRTGVILAFEGNRALVKADKAERRVEVSVTGPVAGRRRLLAIIRSDFDRIHRSYKFEPEALVPVPGHPTVVTPYRDLEVMEQEGVDSLPQVVGGKVVHVNVKDLLNGVDVEGARPRASARGAKDQPVPLRVFYSYSHLDDGLREELLSHLKILERQKLISSWHDRRIIAGEEWKAAIDENLERADIVLLLVSASFLASNYCYDIEMTRALARHDAGEARVIPVIVGDVDWSGALFARLQALPKDGKPIVKWGPDRYARDSGWRSVAEGLKPVIAEIQSGQRDRARF